MPNLRFIIIDSISDFILYLITNSAILILFAGSCFFAFCADGLILSAEIATIPFRKKC